MGEEKVQRGLFSGLPASLGIAVLYFVIARLSLLCVISPEGLAVFWPASGFMLAVLLLTPWRRWPLPAACAFLANVLANIIGGNSVPVSLGFAAANIFESVLAASLVTRFMGVPLSMSRFRDVMGLSFVGAGAGVALAALAGALVPVVGFGSRYADVWLVWWVADGIGILIVTPLILAVAADREFLKCLPWRRVVEAVILCGVTVVLSWMIFKADPVNVSISYRKYIVMPLFLWAALRLGPRGTSFLLCLLAFVSVAFMAGESGPNVESLKARVVDLQIFLGIAGVTSLALSAILAERRQAEGLLRESEQRFRAIFNSTFQFTGLLTPEGVLIEVNDAAKNSFGVKSEDIIGRSFWEARGWSGDEFRVRQLKEGIARASRGEFVRYEVEQQGAGGARITLDFSLKPILDKSGKVILLIAEGRDITQRTQAEDDLRKSEARFRSYFDFSFYGIAITSLEKGWMQVNDQICAIMGYSRAEILSKTWTEMTYPDDLAPDLEQFNRLLSGEIEQYRMDKRFIRKDGTVIWTSLAVGCVRKPDRKVDYVIALVQDITERKRSEEELDGYRQHLEDLVAHRTAELDKVNRQLSADKERLENANRELKLMQAQLIQAEKMSSLGQLSAGIAHEINNPIGYITTNIFVLKDYTERVEEMLVFYAQLEQKVQGTPDQELQKLLDLIGEFKKEAGMADLLFDFRKLIAETVHGTERVTKIVADLKTLSRDDKEAKEPANINGMLDSALSICWGELKYKVEVVKEYAELPGLMCYPRQMEQVFVNLLVNAAQAIVDRGRITLRTFRKGESVFIEVEDTGSGIQETNLPKIFEPFFTTKEVGLGTGLGLPIAYAVIQKHNGNITVRSVVGKGTVFMVELPLRREA